MLTAYSRCLAEDPLRAELGISLNRILAANPRIQAARDRVAQALERHEELLGFFDPDLTAAAGKAESAQGIPGGTGWYSLSNNAHEVQAGVQVPILPGAYINAGTSGRFLFEGGDYSHLYQTLLGIRVRVPLLRDRGFAQWGLSRSRALAEYNAEVSAVLGLMQDIRHECERATIAAYETLAAYQVSQQATQCFQTLLNDALELSELKVVPAYQVYPAEMELALRREDEEQARQAHELNLIALQRIVGDGKPVELHLGPDQLLASAAALGPLPAVATDDALERNGNHMRILNLLNAARADLHLAENDVKPNLSLNAGIAWQGEDPHRFLSDGSRRSEDAAGGEIVLVYERPLRYRSERSRGSQRQARIAELKQDLIQQQVETQANLNSAIQAAERITARQKLLQKAMEAARQTVEAEGERFRLGEGRSRDVLDAQRDLTSALQRQTKAAADLLRAYYDYRYAAGYPGEP